MYSLTGANVLYFSNQFILNGVYGNPSDFVIFFFKNDLVFKGKTECSHPPKLTNLMVPSYGILLIISIEEHFDIKFLRKRFKYSSSFSFLTNRELPICFNHGYSIMIHE
jgi:hypothetical protein